VSVTNVLKAGLAAMAASAIGLPILVGAATAPVQASVVARTGAMAPAGLHIAGTVKLGAASSLFSAAPNGAVYYTRGSSSVYVVNGTSAPRLAIRAGGVVLALAANSTEVFVDVGRTVTEYSRRTGAKGRQWKLSILAHTRTTAAGLYAVGGNVWGWTDWFTGESGFEYATVSRFSTSSGTVHKVSSDIALLDMAADSAGLYYQSVNSEGAYGYLVHVSPSGSVHRVTDTSLGGPLALAGGRVVLIGYPAGRTYLDGYSAGSLVRTFARRVSRGDIALAGTTAGLLVLTATCMTSVCPSATVSQVSTATGVATAPLGVPDAISLVPGPAAAAIAYRSGSYYLVRLAG